MSEAPQVQIVGVFRDRKDAENAIETLQSRGIERSQLALLGSADAVREQLGLTVAEGPAADKEAKAPVDASEKQNMTPLLAGVPAYRGAVLAAGVAVASGGTAGTRRRGGPEVGVAAVASGTGAAGIPRHGRALLRGAAGGGRHPTADPSALGGGPSHRRRCSPSMPTARSRPRPTER